MPDKLGQVFAQWHLSEGFCIVGGKSACHRALLSAAMGLWHERPSRGASDTRSVVFSLLLFIDLSSKIRPASWQKPLVQIDSKIMTCTSVFSCDVCMQGSCFTVDFEEAEAYHSTVKEPNENSPVFHVQFNF